MEENGNDEDVGAHDDDNDDDEDGYDADTAAYDEDTTRKDTYAEDCNPAETKNTLMFVRLKMISMTIEHR